MFYWFQPSKRRVVRTPAAAEAARGGNGPWGEEHPSEASGPPWKKSCPASSTAALAGSAAKARQDPPGSEIEVVPIPLRRPHGPTSWLGSRAVQRGGPGEHRLPSGPRPRRGSGPRPGGRHPSPPSPPRGGEGASYTIWGSDATAEPGAEAAGLSSPRGEAYVRGATPRPAGGEEASLVSPLGPSRATPRSSTATSSSEAVPPHRGGPQPRLGDQPVPHRGKSDGLHAAPPLGGDAGVPTAERRPIA